MMFMRELPVQESTPMIGSMEKPAGALPNVDEVMAYADRQIDLYLRNLASHLPAEIRDEIRQEARMHCWEAYQRIDRETWKSFIQRRAEGAIKDYIRAGAGFKELGYSKSDKSEPDETSPESDDESAESEAENDEVENSAQDAREEGGRTLPPKTPGKFKQRLSQRVSVISSDEDHALDCEEIAGLCGVYTEANMFDKVHIQWDLVARMAAVDPLIHLVAKFIRGMTEQELAPGFGVTREMLSQRIHAFGLWLDDECGGSLWARQALYAFGLEEHYGIPIEERGDKILGWENEPVDLDSSKSLELMSLFQQEEFPF